MLVYTHRMHFANRANDTLDLFKAGFQEHKQWFMGKPTGPSPFHSSVCLGRPRHPQSPSGGVEAAGSMGVGGVRRGRDTWKVPRQCQRDGFQGRATALWKWCWRVYLSGSPVAFLACKCCPGTWSVPCDSRLLTQRRPTTGTLLAPFLLHADRTASWKEGSRRAGAPPVQKRPGNHLGEVRLGGLLCSHGPGWLRGANSCPPFCLPASGGPWRPWSWRGTVPAGEADLILMSCISPWALPPPQSPSWWKVRRQGGTLLSLWALTERNIVCKKWDRVCYFVLFLMSLCMWYAHMCICILVTCVWVHMYG